MATDPVNHEQDLRYAIIELMTTHNYSKQDITELTTSAIQEVEP